MLPEPKNIDREQQHKLTDKTVQAQFSVNVLCNKLKTATEPVRVLLECWIQQYCKRPLPALHIHLN